MVLDSDVCNASRILRKRIGGQRRKSFTYCFGEDGASDCRSSCDTGHVVLRYHAEYLVGPCCHYSSLNSWIVGLKSFGGNVVGRGVSADDIVVNLAECLPPGRRGTYWVWRALGLPRSPRLLESPFVPRPGILGSLSLRASWLDPLKRPASHPCLRRQIFRLSWRELGLHCDQRGFVFCSEAVLKLQFGQVQMDEVTYLVGAWVPWALFVLSGVGRYRADPTATASNGSSCRLLPIPCNHQDLSGLCRLCPGISGPHRT